MCGLRRCAAVSSTDNNALSDGALLRTGRRRGTPPVVAATAASWAALVLVVAVAAGEGSSPSPMSDAPARRRVTVGIVVGCPRKPGKGT